MDLILKLRSSHKLPTISSFFFTTTTIRSHVEQDTLARTSESWPDYTVPTPQKGTPLVPFRIRYPIQTIRKGSRTTTTPTLFGFLLPFHENTYIMGAKAERGVARVKRYRQKRQRRGERGVARVKRYRPDRRRERRGGLPNAREYYLLFFKC